MNMRLENVRDSKPRFARHLDINFNIGSRIENRPYSFIVVTKQVRKFGDTFSLNGLKNERHRRDLTRMDKEVQHDDELNSWSTYVCGRGFTALQPQSAEGD